MLTPEDQRLKKQAVRWLAGIYTTIALALFFAAFALPSSDPQSARTQLSAAQVLTLR
jgi:hypothetical protein